MRILLSNNTGGPVHWLAGRFPGWVGHLFSPGGQRGPYRYLPYALDNGAYGAFANKTEWDEPAWVRLLEWAKHSGQAPEWVLVPDVVGDKDGTLRNWDRYAPAAKRYGWPLAFAVQDGMTPLDVPADAQVVFVGGSTEWKWETMSLWAFFFPRVHVGRVNSGHRLAQCYLEGVESVDGTGWVRAGWGRQWCQLLAFLESHYRETKPAADAS